MIEFYSALQLNTETFCIENSIAADTIMLRVFAATALFATNAQV
jgi:hypothetical protein